ncbi:MAG: 50S ribosomal protein L21 [Bacilli bacterium]|nr:50S ribosomal protein L21 [Bacilli bacterium]
MKAIIVTGGKQYLVSEGDEIFVEKLDANEKEEVTFDNVLMVDGTIGTPNVKGAKVVAEVVKQGKQRKIRVFTYKNKTKTSRRTKGHRQPYTKLTIKKIVK